MDPSSVCARVQDWLVLPKAEYCEKHGHLVRRWGTLFNGDQYGSCDRCEQMVFRGCHNAPFSGAGEPGVSCERQFGK